MTTIIDLPLEVQLSEIESDIDSYEPLPVAAPAMSRHQAGHICELFARSRHPLLTAGGGVLCAGASAQFTELAELLGVPVIFTLMGWGSIPEDHRLAQGMAGIQTSPAVRQCDVPGIGSGDRDR